MVVSPVRLLILAALLAAGNSWLGYHAGFAPATLSIVSGFSALVAVILGLLRKREGAKLKERLRLFAATVTTPNVLASLALVLFGAGSFVSSVRVIGSPSEDLDLRLFADDRSSTAGSERSLGVERMERFVRWVWPFGRPFSIEVSGYQRYSFDLYPWTGKTIRVRRDLTRSPVILIRVPSDKFALLDGGQVELSNGREVLLPVALASDSASVMIGRKIRIPATSLLDWKSELEADGVPDVEAKKRIRGWKNPVVAAGGSWSSEQRLHAVFRSKDKTEIARADFIIEEVALQDVLLLPVSRN